MPANETVWLQAFIADLRFVESFVVESHSERRSRR